LSQRIWSRLGAEHDAYITVDTEGTEFAGGGLNTCLRDLARFGELMRNDGWAMGQQVIPKAAWIQPVDATSWLNRSAGVS